MEATVTTTVDKAGHFHRRDAELAEGSSYLKETFFVKQLRPAGRGMSLGFDVGCGSAVLR